MIFNNCQLSNSGEVFIWQLFGLMGQGLCEKSVLSGKVARFNYYNGKLV